MLFDLGGRVQLWNRAAWHMCEPATPDEFATSFGPGGAVELVTQDGGVLAPEEWPLARALRGQQFADYDLFARRPNGTWQRAFRYSGSVAPVAGAGGVVLQIADLTPRTAARAGALVGEGWLLRQQLTDCAIFQLDADGRITSWNARAEQINGYGAADVLGRHVSHLYPDGATQTGQPGRDLETALVEGQFESEGWRVRQDGTRFWASVSIAALREGHGRPSGFVHVMRDVTLWKRLQTEQDQRADAQERRSEAQDRRTEELIRSNTDLEQFAYIASHDLQEPLRMVSSYVELFAERYKGRIDERADRYIGYVVEGASRMQALIRDLLEYSRVSIKPRTLNAVDGNAVMRDTVTNLRKPIEETGARVTHDHLPTLFADPSQLAQVFQNLVSNALKFCTGRVPTVHVSALLRGAEWVFVVRDNGIGIAPEHTDRIFLLFRQLHPRGLYPGTGIGLAICKKVVERHGGRIWVESQLGVGSAFHFTIPNERMPAP